MGGFGTWGIAAGHPKRFAALVPVCGGLRRDNPGTPPATQDSMAQISMRPRPRK
jgi:predicted peptidase